MQTVSTEFETENIKAENIPVFLFKIGFQEETPLRFTNFDKPVMLLNGSVSMPEYNFLFIPRGISFTQVKRTLSMEIESCRVTLDNIDDMIINWSASVNPIGNPIRIMKSYVDRRTLGNPACTLVGRGNAPTIFYGRITSMTFDIEVQIEAKTHLDFDKQLSQKSGQFLNCRWIFKDSNCGYTGAQTSCDYSFTRCQALGNQLRFGGFPHLNDYYEGP